MANIKLEDALQQGIARANKTQRNVRSAWVKEQHEDRANSMTGEGGPPQL